MLTFPHPRCLESGGTVNFNDDAKEMLLEVAAVSRMSVGELLSEIVQDWYWELPEETDASDLDSE